MISTASERSSSAATAWLDNSYAMADISVRLEGPYFTPADPARYNTVICLVAGTGISGAIAIAGAFAKIIRDKAECCDTGGKTCTLYDPSTVVWKRCVIVWSVREEDYVELPLLQRILTPLLSRFGDLLLTRLEGKEPSQTALEVQVHLTGKGRPRLDMYNTLSSIQSREPEGSMWAYLSGPNRFIEAGEDACKATTGIDWYAARWDI